MDLQHDNLCVWYQFDKAYWSLEIAKELSEAGFTIKEKYEDTFEVSWYVD